MDNRIHKIYMSMLKRCSGDTLRFKSYSKLGIKVCDEWLNDYQKFEDWSLSHGYADGLCLDRMNTVSDTLRIIVGGQRLKRTRETELTRVC